MARLRGAGVVVVMSHLDLEGRGNLLNWRWVGFLWNEGICLPGDYVLYKTL